MSYCVNCGVELEISLSSCPLCNTPIVNPKQLAIQRAVISPFPKEKGIVEDVKRTDLSILMCTILAATSLTCGITNLFVGKGVFWSLPIIGACILLWVFSLPFLIYTNLPISISLARIFIISSNLAPTSILSNMRCFLSYVSGILIAN